MVDAKVYPQLARLDEQGDAISTVHDFFDWLDQQGLELCRVERGTGHDRYLPHIEDRDATIYRFVGIDPQAIERERRALLAAHTSGVPLVDRQVSGPQATNDSPPAGKGE